MRDLLTVLGIDKVTVVGHSFGGGVAMQFAYQFPERTERIVLVSPGGLGREVTPSSARSPARSHRAGGRDDARPAARRQPGSARCRAPLAGARDLAEVATIYEALADPQRARRPSRRPVVDLRGQSSPWSTAPT